MHTQQCSCAHNAFLRVRERLPQHCHAIISRSLRGKKNRLPANRCYPARMKGASPPMLQAPPRRDLAAALRLPCQQQATPLPQQCYILDADIVAGGCSVQATRSCLVAAATTARYVVRRWLLQCACHANLPRLVLYAVKMCAREGHHTITCAISVGMRQHPATFNR
jgi:hypothetical protein